MASQTSQTAKVLCFLRKTVSEELSNANTLLFLRKYDKKLSDKGIQTGEEKSKKIQAVEIVMVSI